MVLFTNSGELAQGIFAFTERITNFCNNPISNSCIGGSRMALVCHELQHGTDARDKARCLEAFERVKQEYQTLRYSFDHILQLEKSIVSGEA